MTTPTLTSTTPPTASPSDERPRHRRFATPAILALLAAASHLASCGKPLLSPNDERSQYDRYDRVRHKYAPQFIQDEYGREVPNLKGRLAPKK